MQSFGLSLAVIQQLDRFGLVVYERQLSLRRSSVKQGGGCFDVARFISWGGKWDHKF